MSLSANVELEWGGGAYLFALKAKQIEELEHLTGEGIGMICMRVFSRSDYKYKHIRESIRLGLIGGGLPPVEATRLVNTYVDGCPIDPINDPSSPLKTAMAVLKAVHFGWEALPEQAPVGEPQETDGQTSESTAPPSSATE